MFDLDSHNFVIVSFLYIYSMRLCKALNAPTIANSNLQLDRILQHLNAKTPFRLRTCAWWLKISKGLV